MCADAGVLSYRGHRAESECAGGPHTGDRVTLLYSIMRILSESECAGGPHTASQNPPAHVADVPRGRPFWWWWRHGYWRRYDAGMEAQLKALLKVYQCRRRTVGAAAGYLP